jgi:hypothetical protein
MCDSTLTNGCNKKDLFVPVLVDSDMPNECDKVVLLKAAEQENSVEVVSEAVFDEVS